MHDVLAIYEELMLVAREMLVIYGRLLIDIHGIHEQLIPVMQEIPVMDEYLSSV